MRYRLIIIPFALLLATCLAKAETVGQNVHVPVGFSPESNMALPWESSASRLINGIEDLVSKSWFGSNCFQKLPVDYSTNFVPGSQYWTQVPEAGSFRDELKRFKPPHPAVAGLYARFSRASNESADFAGGEGPLGSSRDLQLAIWHVQSDLDRSTSKSEKSATDWLSNPLTLNGNNGLSSYGTGPISGASGTGGLFGSSASGDFGGGNGGAASGGASAASSIANTQSVATTVGLSNGGIANGPSSGTGTSDSATTVPKSGNSALNVAVVPLPSTAWGGLGLIAILLCVRGLNRNRATNPIENPASFNRRG